jgi:hypothetical protein
MKAVASVILIAALHRLWIHKLVLNATQSTAPRSFRAAIWRSRYGKQTSALGRSVELTEYLLACKTALKRDRLPPKILG